MKGQKVMKGLSFINPKYIHEGELESISTLEKSTHSHRKLIALILAACLVFALAATAYATGAIQSLLSKFANGFILETPTDELRESRPDYAEWLDEQWETRAVLEEIAGKAQQVHEEKNPEGLADASITLLESYYDGMKFSMACQFDEPLRPVTFDVDKDDPQFADPRSSRTAIGPRRQTGLPMYLGKRISS